MVRSKEERKLWASLATLVDNITRVDSIAKVDGGVQRRSAYHLNRHDERDAPVMAVDALIGRTRRHEPRDKRDSDGCHVTKKGPI